MDVTPNKKMLIAMMKMCDASIGEEPSELDVSAVANGRRVKRRHMMDLLHQMVALSMREGVRRKVEEILRLRAGAIQDKEDRNAVARAIEDAMAGNAQVLITGAN